MDNAVQVAGINVYKSHVRNILMQHPRVKDCAVRVMRPDEGTQLKAFIVPARTNDKNEELKSSLRTFCKNKLSMYEQPMAWTFGPQIPVNELSKDTD